jgi:flagellar basal body P-ring formation protein FlgA
MAASNALPSRPSPAVRVGFAVLLACAAAVAPHAHAQALDATADMAQSTQRWLEAAVGKAQSLSGSALRMEVSVGTLDERLRLAPCARVEPYIPPGTRLWGKTRLGLRCVEGATRWNVFLPVTIKAFGPAWVVNGTVASGAVLAATDAVETEVDWAAETAPVLADSSQWVGQVAARPLTPGQTLRQGVVRPPQVFQAGAQVRIVAQGAGFSVASDGQALGAGAVGQQVRVRMENGRMVSGTVLDERTVRIAL